MHWTVALFISYLFGSVPTAYLAGRLLKGIDLRTVGSGNLGATNVYRSLGTVPALLVLVLDALKGFVPVALLPSQLSGVYFFEYQTMVWWGLACGVAAIIGHTKPIFLLGRGGGKGVATAAGVFGALAPPALAIALLVFLTVAFGTGIVSLASIAAAVAMPLAVGLTLGVGSPIFVISLVVSTFVVWSHRKNIQRLRVGLEPRTFGRKPDPEPDPRAGFEIRRVSDHGLGDEPFDEERE
jgi:glycerol-3-phosphate acyltransferase PlsY